VLGDWGGRCESKWGVWGRGGFICKRKAKQEGRLAFVSVLHDPAMLHIYLNLATVIVFQPFSAMWSGEISQQIVKDRIGKLGIDLGMDAGESKPRTIWSAWRDRSETLDTRHSTLRPHFCDAQAAHQRFAKGMADADLSPG
jgi:hypothetical protein